MRVPPGPPADTIHEALDRLAGPVHGPVGVAVSGGGDSVALLRISAAWASARGRTIVAASVDHGLRAEAPEECAFAAGVAAACGVAHTTLTWRWDGQGNLPAQARAGRYDALARWAVEQRLGAVLLGHTQDDQAETVLINLARGSGLDGLTAMPGAKRDRGTLWLRPMLGVRREALRGWLREHGHGWCDDPTNEDSRFQRVRVREALAVLAPLGVTAERLAATAARLVPQRAVLDDAVAALAAEALTWGTCGEALLLPGPFLAARPETRARLLAALLRHIGGGDYRPPRERIDRLLDVLALPASGDLSAIATLSGCVIGHADGAFALWREPERVSAPMPLVPGETSLWDHRWRIAVPADWPADTTAGALGIRRPGDDPLPPPALRACLPAIRAADGALLAVPSLGITPENCAKTPSRGDVGPSAALLLPEFGTMLPDVAFNGSGGAR